MEPSSCFAYLIEKSKRLSQLSPSQRLALQEDLRFFLNQSLCDQDRRVDMLAIRRKWRSFEIKEKGTRLLDEPISFLLPIHSFIGLQRLQFTQTQALAENRYHKWDVHDFFSDLLKELQMRKDLHRVEKLLVFCVLKYLLLEADRPRPKREMKTILFLWKTIKPILENHHLLKKYKGADILRGRVKLFLTGSF